MTIDVKCSRTMELLDDYLDDALPPRARQGAEAHLDTCHACRRVSRELRCTRRLLGRLPRESMPDPMKKTLLDTLRSDSEPQ